MFSVVMLMNVKTPTNVCIFTFMSRINSVLSLVGYGGAMASVPR